MENRNRASLPRLFPALFSAFCPLHYYFLNWTSPKRKQLLLNRATLLLQGHRYDLDERSA